MTNTGDFRRYSYSSDTSYAVKAFNISRSSAAPAYKPDTKRDLKVRENNKRKSKKELISQQRISFKKAAVIMITAVLSMAMLFSVLHSYAKKNELTYEINNLETELSVAESENTRINSELNALVSVSMIDKYAVEKLGMTKMQSSQIRYIDVENYKNEYQIAMQRLVSETQ